MKNWSKEKKEFWEKVYCATIAGYFANSTFDPDMILSDAVEKAKAVADRSMALWEENFSQ